MKLQLIKPKEIHVGYNKRNDTYTNRLGFITYKDDKGKLKKEKSWENWSDKNIKPDVFENKPTEGFVLNNNVGGGKGGWDYYAREMKIRVYDPRGFEIEITVNNLMYIIGYNGITPGKAIAGEYVYAWDGTELILVPCNTPDYKEIEAYNDFLSNNFSLKAKDLVVGQYYIDSKKNEYIYVGSFNRYEFPTELDLSENNELKLIVNKKTKTHVFAELYGSNVYLRNISNLKTFKNKLDKKADESLLKKINQKLSKEDSIFNYKFKEPIELNSSNSIEEFVRKMWSKIYKYILSFSESIILVDKESKPTYLFKIIKELKNGSLRYSYVLHQYFYDENKDKYTKKSIFSHDFVSREVSKFYVQVEDTYTSVETLLDSIKENDLFNRLIKNNYYLEFNKDLCGLDETYNKSYLPLNYKIQNYKMKGL